MTVAESDSARVLIAELLGLTRQMALKTEDVDFLLEGVNRRQLMMDEIDKLANGKDDLRHIPELRLMVDEIISLDRLINEALLGHHEAAKREVSASNTQNQVLKYTNQAISSSGSYMDYKK